MTIAGKNLFHLDVEKGEEPLWARPHHVDFLHQELLRRKRRNPRYSLRAFAHCLGLDPAALSRILAGKQDLSLKATTRALEALKLKPHERESFLASVTHQISDRAAAFLRRPAKAAVVRRRQTRGPGSVPASTSGADGSTPLIEQILRVNPERLGEVCELLRTFARTLESIFGADTSSPALVIQLYQAVPKNKQNGSTS